MVACPSCGSENADSAKFCSECGAALVTQPVGKREERKVVTVVFADMVGSTERAERLDRRTSCSPCSLSARRGELNITAGGEPSATSWRYSRADRTGRPERAVRCGFAVRRRSGR
jgi:hypothetical protein